jgi:hypothetical protein
MFDARFPGWGMGRRAASQSSARSGRSRLRSGGLPGRLRSSAILGLALALAACAATQVPATTEPGSPGFLLGVWHGFIFPIAFIISLFTDSVAVYAVPNNGGWYDFGYFVGIVFIGVGARRSHVIYRDRVIWKRG